MKLTADENFMTRQSSTNKYEQYGDRHKNRVIIRVLAWGWYGGCIVHRRISEGAAPKALVCSPPNLRKMRTSFDFSEFPVELAGDEGIFHPSAVARLETANKYRYRETKMQK